MLHLRELRLAADITQVELAGLLGWEQARVSRFENQSDWKFSSLIAYLQALGAAAELVIRLPAGATITQDLTKGEKR